jgi:uncharacterized protein
MKGREALLPVTSKQGSQKADLICGKSAILLWYLPTIGLSMGFNWAPARAWLWIPAFLVICVGCLVNAAQCGRLHCFVTGPVYLLAAIYTALAAFGLVPMRPNVFLLIVLAITICAFVAEWPLGTYRDKSIMTQSVPSYLRLSGGPLRRVFVGERGIRAGWSVLLFAAIFWSLQTAVMAGLGRFVTLDVTGPIPLSLGLLQESCQVLVVAADTFVMARIEKRPLLSYGYTGQHKLIRLATGVILGFFCLSVLVGALWSAGLLAFDGMVLSGLMAWKYALGWGLLFLLVGFFEESLLRGYAQHTLSRGIGFWWAALLLSVVFALGHLGNGGEATLGIVEVGIAGLVFCLSLWYTKSLWWAAGFHAGWDWGQSYFYGTPDSGLVIKGHLLASHPGGNPLWSGGTVGPEGSLLIMPLVILVGTGMWLWWGVSKKLSSGRNAFATTSG